MLRIAGVQGFYGDSPMGAIAIAKEGAADYLVHDALAELTLSILQKDRMENPSLGYARDIEFLATSLYPLALQKGIKIVTNSGGLNPVSAAKKVSEILKKKGISGVKIAAITGDDMLAKLDETGNLFHLESGEKFVNEKVSHANVYVGASCIAEALAQGAQIIFAGRVADPCLTLGILVHHFKWNLTPNPSPFGEGRKTSPPAPLHLEKGAADLTLGESVENNRIGNLFKGANPALFENAHRLRLVDKTKAELLLWQAVRNNKIANCKFRRQHPIGKFIADFYCHEKKLVIEVDGGYHNEKEQQEYDEARTNIINEYGVRVTRFTNEEIINDINSVVENITREIKSQSSAKDTPPLQMERGQGGEVNWDLLAAGITIGHILECGGQASGGNSYAEWKSSPSATESGKVHGYPIAHVKEDGLAIFTKLESAEGKVSRDTIREQLVYEIHDPANYITPDVIVDLTQISLEEIAPNKVLLKGAKGKPRPEKLKLAIGKMEGFLSEQFFFFSYPYAYKKAQKFVEAVKGIWNKLPLKIERQEFSFIGINGIHGDAAPMPSDEVIEQMNEIGIRIAIKHPDEATGKIAFQSIVSLALNGPPGLVSMPGWGKQNRMLLSLFPTLIDRKWVQMEVTIIDV